MKWKEPQNNIEKCTLIKSEQELEKTLQTKDHCFILFYAAWCPFSQRFLSIYERCAKETDYECFLMDIDDYPHLCDRYAVEVYPTIIFFEKGNIVERVDGLRGIGLNESQFKDLIKVCHLRK
jgi:thioredoxin-like negative regulator of GroEL